MMVGYLIGGGGGGGAVIALMTALPGSGHSGVICDRVPGGRRRRLGVVLWQFIGCYGPPRLVLRTTNGWQPPTKMRFAPCTLPIAPIP